jgi:hypothetical protein
LTLGVEAFIVKKAEGERVGHLLPVHRFDLVAIADSWLMAAVMLRRTEKNVTPSGNSGIFIFWA